MRLKGVDWLRQARLYGLALIGVVLVTLGSVTLREVLTLANFTMIYLLLVVIMA
ncbi:MAG: hypothetical protein IT326_01345, partial [Anaerolineae bacterium]|nr:hypothetical protein [Anaerolineae bacterium]